MAKIKFFVDPIGNTFCMWYTDPKEEVVCEQNDLGDILSLNEKGAVIGFEKLNFLPQEFIDQLQTLPETHYEGKLLKSNPRMLKLTAIKSC